MALRRLGYWQGGDSQPWPDAHDFVDDSWEEEERSIVVQYLRGGTVARAFLGFSRCRICGVDNGSLEFSDGCYIWPQGLAHYVEAHAVRLPQEFIVHAVARTEDFEYALVDDEWWRTATGVSGALDGPEDGR